MQPREHFHKLLARVSFNDASLSALPLTEAVAAGGSVGHPGRRRVFRSGRTAFRVGLVDTEGVAHHFVGHDGPTVGATQVCCVSNGIILLIIGLVIFLSYLNQLPCGGYLLIAGSAMGISVGCWTGPCKTTTAHARGTVHTLPHDIQQMSRSHLP